MLIDRDFNWTANDLTSHIHFAHFTNTIDHMNAIDGTTIPSAEHRSAAALRPTQYASLTEHIKFNCNVTNNNYKGKLVLYKIMSYVVNMLPTIFTDWHIRCKTFLIDIELKLFVILNLDRMNLMRNWYKMYQLLLAIGQTNRIKRDIWHPHIVRLVEYFYFAYRWLTLIVTMLAFAFLIHQICKFVELFLVMLIQMHVLPCIVTMFQAIYLWKSLQWSNTNNKSAPMNSKCECFDGTGNQRPNDSNDNASEYLDKKNEMHKQRIHAEKELLYHALWDPISTKSMAKSGLFLKPFLNKSPIKYPNSIIIVRMVQIVMTHDKNATGLTQSVSDESGSAEPIQHIDRTSNEIAESSSTNAMINGDGAVEAIPVADTGPSNSVVNQFEVTTAPSTINATTTLTFNSYAQAYGNIEENTSKVLARNAIQASTVRVTTPNSSSNKKSNVIMVKRSKLKDTSNGVVPMFRSVNVSTTKAIENRSTSTAASVIIMNKLGQAKNGSNLTTKTESYETPTRTNHLLRILNSPPKPINTSQLASFGSNLERTISTASVSDLQKTFKITTTVSNEASVSIVNKNENTINVDQAKLRYLLNNDQNGNKKMNNNLYICKTEGKVIRLTPLMGSNCFNNVTTAAIQPTIANEVKVMPDLQPKGQMCPIILEKKDSMTSKSPPPLTLAMSSSNSSTTKTTPTTVTHSVFEEIYAKFMHSKDAQKDNCGTVNDGVEKKNGISTLMDVDESKIIKSNFFSIPSSAAMIQSKQQTYIQCQGGLLKAEPFNANHSVSATFTPTDNKTGVKPNAIQTSPAIYLKQIAKNRHPQTKAGLCEILVTNENDLKVLQKTSNDGNNLNATATIANPSLNQIHIFPLITSNGRNVSISSAQPRANVVRPQVIITGGNASDGRVPKNEPEKRNLVDQLREFDMVMEQIKEERNTNETTDKLMLNNLSGILNHHIIDSSQMRSVGLPQKINLAIIKKSATPKTMITNKKTNLTDTKRNTGTPVVVVTSANVVTPKTGRITIEPTHEVLERANSTVTVTTNANTKVTSETTVAQTSFENVTSVRMNSPNIKTITTQAPAQNVAAKHPPKSQEDEQTVQRIYDILAQYAEQISSSPDLNNKPAPRRRSNLVSIQSSPITSTSIRMVSTKSSMSSTSSTTVGSMMGSSSNSNSSNESYQGGILTESRKRTLSFQNDDINGSDCGSNIDTFTIHQPADKKRRISNISLDGNDFILTTVPSLTTVPTYTTLTKTSSNEMLKTNNQILITTTNAHSNAEVHPATMKSDSELLLTNGTTSMAAKLKPLTIGIANNSTVDASSKAQSPATILLPGVSVVVSSEQNYQQTQPKFITSTGSTGEAPRFCGFTTGFPYKINIAGPNKSRPFKQCISGQSFRSDNYLLPMGILKYGKGQTMINEQQKISQIVHPNMATVVIPSANVQRDLGTNVKIVSDCGGTKEMPKAQHFQFNIAKKSDGFTSIPTITTTSQNTPTLLFRTLSGTNIGGIHGLNKKSDDGFESICEQLKNSNDNASNLLTTFAPMKSHQSESVSPLVESIQMPSQIFQSNRGILILDGNKYATLLTTNCTLPTTTAPVMTTETKSCIDDIRLSNAINEPKVSAITTPSTTTTIIQSGFSKLDLKVPSMCDNDDDDDFLLENGLNVDSPPDCGDCGVNGNDDSNEPFDDLQSGEQIFSLKTLPTLYGGDFSKSTDDILAHSDHSHSDVIDDTQELIFHQHDKSSDNVVIIDKQKSDSLTLNSVSSEQRMNARTTSIIERELRLQKSLSEECEDLGVDEPSTSELFPDAFISF